MLLAGLRMMVQATAASANLWVNFGFVSADLATDAHFTLDELAKVLLSLSRKRLSKMISFVSGIRQWSESMLPGFCGALARGFLISGVIFFTCQLACSVCLGQTPDGFQSVPPVHPAPVKPSSRPPTPPKPNQTTKTVEISNHCNKLELDATEVRDQFTAVIPDIDTALTLTPQSSICVSVVPMASQLFTKYNALVTCVNNTHYFFIPWTQPITAGVARKKCLGLALN